MQGNNVTGVAHTINVDRDMSVWSLDADGGGMIDEVGERRRCKDLG